MGSMCYTPFSCAKDVIYTEEKGVSFWKTTREKRELCSSFLLSHTHSVLLGIKDAEKEQILWRDCSHSAGEFSPPSSFLFLSIKNLFGGFIISGAVKLLTSALQVL